MTLFRSLATAVMDARAIDLTKPTSQGQRWIDTFTGKTMTRERALTMAALYRATRIISDIGAAMPVHVFQKTNTGAERVDSPGLPRVLQEKPNTEVSPFTFWNTLISNYTLSGNIFTLAPGNSPTELLPVDPLSVKVGRDDKGRKAYEISLAGGDTLPAVDQAHGGDMLHAMSLSTDGLRGLSIVTLGANGFGLAHRAEEFAATFFKQGSLPGGYLTTDQPLTAQQAQDISEGWEALHGGAENAHRIGVLGRGTKWMHTSLSPEDSMLMATRQFQVADVARWTGVPEHLLGTHDKQSSWGTGLLEQNKGLLQFVIDPILVNVEQTFSQLLPRGQFMKFVREGLLRMDAKDRGAFYAQLRNLGVLSANQIAQLEDMPPVAEGGDDLWRPVNIAVVGEEPATLPASPTTPPADEEA